MSSWDAGSVRAEYDGKDVEITVEGGSGWGGDGECFHTVLLDISDIVGDDVSGLILLTSRDARSLAEMMISVADAGDDRLIEEGL